MEVIIIYNNNIPALRHKDISGYIPRIRAPYRRSLKLIIRERRVKRKTIYGFTKIINYPLYILNII